MYKKILSIFFIFLFSSCLFSSPYNYEPKLKYVDILQYNDTYNGVANAKIKNGESSTIESNSSLKMLPSVNFAANTSLFDVSYEFTHLTSVKKYKHYYVFSPTNHFYIPLQDEGTISSFKVYPEPYKFFPFDRKEIKLNYKLDRLDNEKEEANITFKFNLNDINTVFRNNIFASGLNNVVCIGKHILSQKYLYDTFEKNRYTNSTDSNSAYNYKKLIFVFNANGTGTITFYLKNASTNIFEYNITGTFDSNKEYYGIISLSDEQTSGNIQFIPKGVSVEDSSKTLVTSGANTVLTKTTNGFDNKLSILKNLTLSTVDNIHVEAEQSKPVQIGNFIIYGCR